MFACLSAILILCGLTFIPVLPPNKQSSRASDESKFREVAEKLIYLDNWRNKRFVVWTLAIPLALFGYFVPYVHLVRYSISAQKKTFLNFQPKFAQNIPLDEDENVNGEKASKLIMCIGVSSGTN